MRQNKIYLCLNNEKINNKTLIKSLIKFDTQDTLTKTNKKKSSMPLNLELGPKTKTRHIKGFNMLRHQFNQLINMLISLMNQLNSVSHTFID